MSITSCFCFATAVCLAAVGVEQTEGEQEVGLKQRGHTICNLNLNTSLNLSSLALNLDARSIWRRNEFSCPFNIALAQLYLAFFAPSLACLSEWPTSCPPQGDLAPAASINFDSICFRFSLSAEEDFIVDKFINPSKPAEIEIEKVEEEPLVVS